MRQERRPFKIGVFKLMKLFFLFILLFPAFTYAENPTLSEDDLRFLGLDDNRQTSMKFTREEILLMNRFGVRVGFPSEYQAYVIPKDINPSRLIEADLLDFSNIQLISIPPWLKKFTNLRKLDLSNTEITAKGLEETLQSMKLLDILDLSDNPLFDSGFEFTEKTWLSTPNLAELYLEGTGCQLEKYGSLISLKNLVKLSFNKKSKNRIKRENDAKKNGLVLPIAPGLVFSGNDRIFKLLSLKIYTLPRLREIGLEGCGIKNPSILTALPERTLTSLDLRNNHLSNIEFKDMPRLEFLDLRGNGIITLEEEFGGLFSFKNLSSFQYDRTSQQGGKTSFSYIPRGLLKKLR